MVRPRPSANNAMSTDIRHPAVPAKAPRPLARRSRPTGNESPGWRWAALGAIAGLLGGLLAYAPAAWVALAVERVSQGRVGLHEPRGAWWNGSARLMLSSGEAGSDRTVLPGRLSWRMVPGWGSGAGGSPARGPLLTLSLAADCCTPSPWRFAAEMPGFATRVHVRADASRWPAGLLSGLGTPWNTIEPEGFVHLRAPRAVVTWAEGRWALEGDIVVEARSVSTRLSTLRPMGNYRMDVRGGAVPTVSLQTLEPSSLHLNGQGQWVGNRLRFEGSASAAEGRAEALSNLLNIIGRRDGTRSIIRLG